MENKVIKISVYNKKLIIKGENIRKWVDDEFWAIYKQYEIFIDKEMEGNFFASYYVRVHDPKGLLVFDGWYEKTFQDCLKICLEKVLTNEIK